MQSKGKKADNRIALRRHEIVRKRLKLTTIQTCIIVSNHAILIEKEITIPISDEAFFRNLIDLKNAIRE